MSYVDDARELSTVRDFIRWAASCMNEAELFFGHGTRDALEEAAVLVLYTLHLSPPLSPELLDARLTGGERQRIAELLGRRIGERAPLAHLTHEAWFAGRVYYVDSRVLVPRSPIAELIQNRFRPWIVDAAPARRILDLCSGSGCIGIACAHEFPRAQVDLGEIDAGAVEVAEINLLAHGVEDRVAVFESDLFDAFAGHDYDLVIGNPPYVARSEHEALPREYHCEPELGLVAAERGLGVVARILGRAAGFMTAQGLLIVEVGASWPEVVARWPTVPFVWLTFQHGGEGVFLLTREQLQQHAAALQDDG